MKRIKALREHMAKREADAMLISSAVGQLYIGRFGFEDGYLLITEEKAYLVTDFRYIEAAKKQCHRTFEVVLAKGGTLKETMELVRLHHCKSLAFEEDYVSFSAFKDISEKLDGVRFLPVGSEILSSMRAIKDEEEIDKIAAAQSITDMAYEHILSVLNHNMTEIDVALELEFFIRQKGAESVAFPIIAVSGDGSALPHGTPRNRKLKRGFLTMDFGARLDGYCSDMTRTVVIGSADVEMKRLYATVLAAGKAALERICAGVGCSGMDKLARDIIDSGEYKGTFGHSLGHGVGLEIHEAPSVSPRSDAVLKEGNVITVEPGIYIEGKYGCRIEDMVAVTKGGIRNFTKSPKELVEI